jgi:hypothetical protein
MNASPRLSLPQRSDSSLAGPTARNLAACINEMRSHRSPSFMKRVDRKIVTPSSRDRLIRYCQKESRAIGSTPEVGSSRISTFFMFVHGDLRFGGRQFGLPASRRFPPAPLRGVRWPARCRGQSIQVLLPPVPGSRTAGRRDSEYDRNRNWPSHLSVCFSLTGRRFGRDAACTTLRRQPKAIRRCGVPAQH